MKKVVVFLLVGLMFVFGMAGCEKTKKEEGKEKAKEKVVTELKDGKLTLGSDTAFPPFEYEEGDKVVGFDVDLGTEIGKRMDVEVEFVPTAFDGIIPALNAKKFDGIMSAMTITDERKKEVDFSDPYIDSNQSLTVKKDSGIKSVKDLSGKILGVQRGTTGELTAQKNQTTWGVTEIKSYDDTLLAFEDLKAGRIAGIINDFPVSAYLAKKTPELEVVEEIPTNEQYGIALRKESKDLKKKIDEALKEIKDDGTYDTIFEKWFGKKPS